MYVGYIQGILRLMESLHVRQGQEAYRLAATLCYTENDGLELLGAMDVSVKQSSSLRVVLLC